MKIDTIWESLENDKGAATGLLLRRYSSIVLPNVFVALTVPENQRCIAASISTSINLNLTSFSNLRDIHIEIIPDPKKADKKLVIFKLLSDLHKDVFSVLCEDLMRGISDITDEDKLSKELVARFEKWKSIFDKTHSQGLTPEEQRGLFAELYLIRKLLYTDQLSIDGIISSWVGPSKQIKDFQYQNWAIEVKSSFGNNHQKIHISSERQLDSKNLEYLFLFHLSLEVRQLSGETLTQIIGSITDILSREYVVLNQFKTKLFETGFFDHHVSIYDVTGYLIRQETFYHVKDNFPRIEEGDIMVGIGDVKYSIILSQISEYLTTEQDVLQKLIF